MFLLGKVVSISGFFFQILLVGKVMTNSACQLSESIIFLPQTMGQRFWCTYLPPQLSQSCMIHVNYLYIHLYTYHVDFFCLFLLFYIGRSPTAGIRHWLTLNSKWCNVLKNKHMMQAWKVNFLTRKSRDDLTLSYHLTAHVSIPYTDIQYQSQAFITIDSVSHTDKITHPLFGNYHWHTGVTNPITIIFIHKKRGTALAKFECYITLAFSGWCHGF